MLKAIEYNLDDFESHFVALDFREINLLLVKALISGHSLQVLSQISISLSVFCSTALPNGQTSKSLNRLSSDAIA